MSLQSLTKDLGLDNFLTTLKEHDDRFIVLSRSEETRNEWIWSLMATDGKTVWKKNWTKQQLQDDLATDSVRQSLADFKKFAENKNLKLSNHGDEIILSMENGDSRTNFSLAKTSSKENVSEISSLLFYLCDQTMTKQRSQQSSEKNYPQSLTDLESHRKNRILKIRPRQGMSLVNPGTKRMKTTKGIRFESSE